MEIERFVLWRRLQKRWWLKRWSRERVGMHIRPI